MTQKLLDFNDLRAGRTAGYFRQEKKLVFVRKIIPATTHNASFIEDMDGNIFAEGSLYEATTKQINKALRDLLKEQRDVNKRIRICNNYLQYEA